MVSFRIKCQTTNIFPRDVESTLAVDSTLKRRDFNVVCPLEYSVNMEYENEEKKRKERVV